MWYADVQKARFFYARAWMDYLHIFGVREQRANASCHVPFLRYALAVGRRSVGYLARSAREVFFTCALEKLKLSTGSSGVALTRTASDPLRKPSQPMSNSLAFTSSQQMVHSSLYKSASRTRTMHLQQSTIGSCAISYVVYHRRPRLLQKTCIRILHSGQC